MISMKIFLNFICKDIKDSFFILVVNLIFQIWRSEAKFRVKNKKLKYFNEISQIFIFVAKLRFAQSVFHLEPAI